MQLSSQTAVRRGPGSRSPDHGSSNAPAQVGPSRTKDGQVHGAEVLVVTTSRA